MVRQVPDRSVRKGNSRRALARVPALRRTRAHPGQTTPTANASACEADRTVNARKTLDALSASESDGWWVEKTGLTAHYWKYRQGGFNPICGYRLNISTTLWRAYAFLKRIGECKRCRAIKGV